MVTYKSVIKAVNAKLQSKFPNIVPAESADQTYHYTSADTEEGIKRPCFMVDLEGFEESCFMQTYRDRNFEIKIKYFATKDKKNTIENLSVIDDLSALFIDDSFIIADDYGIEIFDEIDIDIIGTVVHYNIPVFISEEIERIDNTPLLEELEVDVRKE